MIMFTRVKKFSLKNFLFFSYLFFKNVNFLTLQKFCLKICQKKFCKKKNSASFIIFCHFLNIQLFRGAHCSDMYPQSANDHPELIAARNKIHTLLDGFIRASSQGT